MVPEAPLSSLPLGLRAVVRISREQHASTPQSGRLERGFKKVAAISDPHAQRRFPSLRFLGFGLFLGAWFTARLSPIVWLSASRPNARQGVLLLAVGTAAYALTFLLAILLRKRLSPLHERVPLLVGAAILAGVGLASISLNGLAFMGVGGSVIGVTLCDIAAGVLLLAWGELYGSIGFQEACIGVSGSFLAGAGVFAVATLLGPIAPPLTAVGLACCPMLSLALLRSSWKDSRVRPLDAEAQGRAFRMPARLVIGIFACGFAIGFMVILGISHAGSLTRGASLVSPMSIAAVALVTLTYALFKQVADLRLMPWSVLFLLAVAFMLLPVAGYAYASQVVTFGYACLEMSWFLVCSDITYRVSAPAIATVGWGALANYGGALAGGSACAVLVGRNLGVWQLSVVSIAMVSVLLLGAALTLRESTMDALWGLLPQAALRSWDVPEGLVNERCAKAAESRSLTPREQEILVFLAEGRAADDIARVLVISEATVRTHAKRLYQKLGVHSQPQLMRMVVFDSECDEPRLAEDKSART